MSTYVTSNTVEAASYLCHGYTIKNTELLIEGHRKIVSFVFEGLEEQDIKDFSMGSSTVEPSTFLTNYNKLKALVASTLKIGE